MARSWWDRLWRGEADVEEEPIVDDVQQQEREARETERDNAEARADRALTYARNELATYERELWLASGGKRRVKRKRI